MEYMSLLGNVGSGQHIPRYFKKEWEKAKVDVFFRTQHIQ